MESESQTGTSASLHSNSILHDLDSESSVASAPFNAGGDIILQTSDAVEFHVFRVILATASPVFKDILKDTQPDNKTEDPTSILVIPISESSATADALLRFCYPIKSPDLTHRSMSFLRDVLKAALKYRISIVDEPIRHSLLLYAQRSGKDAIAAYTIACHLKMEHEARATAMGCLKWPFPCSVTSDLDLMSGLDYYNLLDFHRRAAAAVVALFQQQEFLSKSCAAINPGSHSCAKRVGNGVNTTTDLSDYTWWIALKETLVIAWKLAPLDMEAFSTSAFTSKLDSSLCHVCKNKVLHGWIRAKEAITAAIMEAITAVELDFSWSLQSKSHNKAEKPITISAPFSGAEGDVILQASDSVDFHVSKFILASASPIFEDMFSLPQPADDAEDTIPLPVIPVSESGMTVDVLLRFCYPVENPQLTDQGISLIGDVLGAALKYEIEAALGPARKALLSRAEMSANDASAAYAIACHLKLDSEARAAAISCLKWPFPGPAIPHLRLLTGLDYYYVLDFHRRASVAVVSLFRMKHFLDEVCAKITASKHLCPGILARLNNNDFATIQQYAWWTVSYNALCETFRCTPLATQKVSLSIFAPALKACACQICRDKVISGWDETRERIISSIKKEVAKVYLPLSWKPAYTRLPWCWKLSRSTYT